MINSNSKSLNLFSRGRRHPEIGQMFSATLSLPILSLLISCGGESGTNSTATTVGGELFFAKSIPAASGHLASALLEQQQATTAVAALRSPTAIELLEWAETAFPSLFPKGSTNLTWGTYVYRLYPSTDLVLGVNTTDGTVVAVTQTSSQLPSNIYLGHLADYACQVLKANCHTDLTAYSLSQRAGVLATAIGKFKRFMVGLGTTTVGDIQAQTLKPDIYDQYLVGAGEQSWRIWNLPAGAYVGVVAANADKVGAVPMYTLYQMATWGDGNIWGLLDKDFMIGYWDNVRIMYQQIKLYSKPALINLEPDFWGYAHRYTSEPSQHFAHVSSVNADCSNLPNSVAGMGECMVQMARSLAPNAYVGFPPSFWGDLIPTELAYMQKVGAGKADFVVMQTQDRDAGCYEARLEYCNPLNLTNFYWDATNQTTPNFTSHFAIARNLHEGLGLPLLWWQTPLGVPSSTPGGTVGAFRDNRAQYFLTHAAEMVAAGGVGVVFSPGHVSQTNINTDGGQFKRLSTQYLAAPAALP